jgi:asparagine synthase (glutamine-hydrolysing)
MAMAHSLEVRVPFLDREVFAAARRLPLGLRIRGKRTKVCLRAVAGEMLPAEVAGRPKLGFPIPFLSWLSGPIGAHVRDLFGDARDPLLDQAALLDTLSDRRPGSEQRIWALMTYLMWQQEQRDTRPLSRCSAA